MSRGRACIFAAATVLGAASPGAAPADPALATDAERPTSARSTAAVHDGREYLVPDLAEGAFRIDEGAPATANHLSFSPAVGRLGDDSLYLVRVGFHPSDRLGYQVTLGHNPTPTTHALFHTVGAVVRQPFASRFVPYADLGFGMMTVFPGGAINADPVTKNTFSLGGGLEVRVREDISLRSGIRGVTVIGRDRGDTGSVAYQYRQFDVGLAFYRQIGR